MCFYGGIRSYGSGRERCRVRDRTGLLSGLIKWLVVLLWQKVTICAPWFSCIRLFTTVYVKNTIAYGFRISSYTVTDIYDRNTITCFMTKYGRIRSVYGMYTVVYATVYDRLRPYTESVTVDLGWYLPKFLMMLFRPEILSTDRPTYD
jgi:hypothetical protein